MASMPWGHSANGESPLIINGGGVAVASSSQQQIMYDNALSSSSKQPLTDMSGASNEHSMPQSPTGALNSNAAEFQPTAKLTAPISFLNRGSTADGDADNNGGRPLLGGSAAPSQAIPPPIAPPAAGNGGAARSKSPGKQFTTDTGPEAKWVGGHYIRIGNINPGTWDSCLRTLDVERGWASAINHMTVTREDVDGNTLSAIMCVDDAEVADQTISDAALVDQKLKVTFITYTEYHDAIKNDKQKMQESPSPYDGQVFLDATYHEEMGDHNADQLRATLRYVASDFDKILAFTINESSPVQWQVRIEFFKISAAHAMIKMLKESPALWYWGWNIALSKPSSPSSDHEFDMHTGLSDAFGSFELTPRKCAPGVGYAYASGTTHDSPTGRTSWSVDAHGRTVPAAQSKMYSRSAAFGDTPSRHMSDPMGQSPAMYDQCVTYNRNGSFPSMTNTPHHQGNKKDDPDGPQVVKRQRILEGSDVRTTIMVRNIPSGWDATKFLAALNVAFAGRFNFSYLRMDFAKGTNVGYAFVNVVEAMDIIAFVDCWVGRELDPAIAPGKICQVSYATIQGTDCLIEKFRNSSILDEYPGFRPKLWWVPQDVPHACTEDMVGQERPFPPPNNLTKRQRSHDNAGSIGLYAPRSSHRGDRARRSNFDRGTPRQVQEDSQAMASPFEANYAIGGPRAPVGTPVPYFPPGFPTMPHPAYYHGHPGFVGHPVHGYPATFADTVDPFTVVSAGHYPPPQQYHGHAGYGNVAAAHSHVNPYGMNQNPASRLRTITHGHLGSRPRNVTVAPNGYSGYADAPNAGPSRIPRSFLPADEVAASNGSAHTGGYVNQQGYGHQQGAEYYYDN